jgi:hypothetical protein
MKKKIIKQSYLKSQIEAGRYKVSDACISGKSCLLQFVSPYFKDLDTSLNPYLFYECTFHENDTLDGVLGNNHDFYKEENGSAGLEKVFAGSCYPVQKKRFNTKKIKRKKVNFEYVKQQIEAKEYFFLNAESFDSEYILQIKNPYFKSVESFDEAYIYFDVVYNEDYKAISSRCIWYTLDVPDFDLYELFVNLSYPHKISNEDYIHDSNCKIVWELLQCGVFGKLTLKNGHFYEEDNVHLNVNSLKKYLSLRFDIRLNQSSEIVEMYKRNSERQLIYKNNNMEFDALCIE